MVFLGLLKIFIKKKKDFIKNVSSTFILLVVAIKRLLKMVLKMYLFKLKMKEVIEIIIKFINISTFCM